MKIHIIGCSGSGKTFLAQKLSKKYNLPHLDLDNIFWDNTAQSYGVKMSVEKRNALLQEVLSKDDWIIEGVYYTWLQQSFEDSDKIYVLNMPRYLYLTRIVIRFLKRKIGLEKGKKESLQSLFALIKWTDCF